MCQKMPNCRTGRSGRLVEVDDTLFGADKQCERGDGLRDRSEAHRASGIAARRNGAVGTDDTGGCIRNRPPVELAKCLHAARY